MTTTAAELADLRAAEIARIVAEAPILTGDTRELVRALLNPAPPPQQQLAG